MKAINNIYPVLRNGQIANIKLFMIVKLNQNEFKNISCVEDPPIIFYVHCRYSKSVDVIPNKIFHAEKSNMNEILLPMSL